MYTRHVRVGTGHPYTRAHMPNGNKTTCRHKHFCTFIVTARMNRICLIIFDGVVWLVVILRLRKRFATAPTSGAKSKSLLSILSALSAQLREMVSHRNHHARIGYVPVSECISIFCMKIKWISLWRMTMVQQISFTHHRRPITENYSRSHGPIL